MKRWPTWREWADRTLVCTCRAATRSLLLAGILETYTAIRGAR